MRADVSFSILSCKLIMAADIPIAEQYSLHPLLDDP